MSVERTLTLQSSMQ